MEAIQACAMTVSKAETGNPSSALPSPIPEGKVPEHKDEPLEQLEVTNLKTVKKAAPVRKSGSKEVKRSLKRPKFSPTATSPIGLISN